MRWTLLALLGAVLLLAGIGGLAVELAHGSDIWRRASAGLGLLVPGAYCLWRGLSERVNGTPPATPIWPGVLLFCVLAGIGVVLYVLAPPLAVLFAIAVLPFGWLRWAGRV
jgi:hypothetical protein